jgi:hypothetical protein
MTFEELSQLSGIYIGKAYSANATGCTVNALPLDSFVNAKQIGLFLFFVAMLKEPKGSTCTISGMSIYAP